MGGGITSISAVELNTIAGCENPNTQCTLQENYPDITNHAHFNGGISLNSKTITNLTNYGTLGNISWGGGTITHITNYGTMGYIAGIRANNPTPTTMSVTNYGIMGGIETQYGNKDIFIANYGVINPTNNSIHFWGTSSNQYHFVIVDYAMVITESASAFANSKGDTSGNNNSHIVLHSQGLMRFDNPNSKIILDFGDNFDFGVAYPLDKLIIDSSGENRLKVGFDRLTTRTSLYKLTQSGDSFIATIDAPNSEIGILHKSNIRTMNNFWTLSNSMIFPRKSYHSQNLTRKNQNNLVILRERSDRRISKNNIIDSSPKAQNDNIMLDSAIPLKSYESFAYRNESINRRIQRQNKRNYSRTKRNNNSVILNDSEESQKKNNRDSSPKAQNDNVRKLQNLKENQSNLQNLNTDSANKTNKTNQHNLRDSANRDYYFILTPFVNYNSFAKSGNYNLNGFDYGFLTAFSAKVAESNSLGAHFIFSYGNLGDSKDKNLSIKSLNLNVGLNYKLDLIYDMYLKARGDFYYFLNQVKTLTMFEAIKPNNLGFGVSVSYGKDFNFGKGGVLGIEAGLDYKALKTNEVSLNSQTYKQSLLNLIYADLGMNYSKYFGGFGINLGSGFKANLAPKLAESTLLINSQTLKFTLDNDKYLAYANAGISYLLNTKNFDMEFSLAYYGNFGDRVISNGGGVEWRVLW